MLSDGLNFNVLLPVRIGGNLVAKGINLVADHIPTNEKHQVSL